MKIKILVIGDDYVVYDVLERLGKNTVSFIPMIRRLRMDGVDYYFWRSDASSKISYDEISGVLCVIDGAQFCDSCDRVLTHLSKIQRRVGEEVDVFYYIAGAKNPSLFDAVLRYKFKWYSMGNLSAVKEWLSHTQPVITSITDTQVFLRPKPRRSCWFLC